MVLYSVMFGEVVVGAKNHGPNVGPAGLLGGETECMFLPPANEVSVGGRAGVAGRGALRLLLVAALLACGGPQTSTTSAPTTAQTTAAPSTTAPGFIDWSGDFSEDLGNGYTLTRCEDGDAFGLSETQGGHEVERNVLFAARSGEVVRLVNVAAVGEGACVSNEGQFLAPGQLHDIIESLTAVIAVSAIET